MKIKLVENWRKLWLAWSMWALAIGAAAPDLLEWLGANIEGLPILNDGHKSLIRFGAILAAMLLRIVKQPAVSGSPKDTP